MMRVLLSALLTLALLAAPLAAEAQPSGRVPRIGYLVSKMYPPVVAAFERGLKEFGYEDGKNIIIEWRSAGSHDLPTTCPERTNVIDRNRSPSPGAARSKLAD
jgi:hypothetical protein